MLPLLSLSLLLLLSSLDRPSDIRVLVDDKKEEDINKSKLLDDKGGLGLRKGRKNRLLGLRGYILLLGSGGSNRLTRLV